MKSLESYGFNNFIIRYCLLFTYKWSFNRALIVNNGISADPINPWEPVTRTFFSFYNVILSRFVSLTKMRER